MRRILSTLLLALGAALIALAAFNFHNDRTQLRTWHRTTAFVEQAEVARVGRTPYRPWHPGGWAPRLLTRWEAEGQEQVGWIIDPMSARRSRERAEVEAREALRRGSYAMLVDPGDARHTSGHWDDPWRYYRDVWQNALPGLGLLLLGLWSRRSGRPSGTPTGAPARRP